MDLIQTDSIERLFHRQESQQTLICLPPGDVFTVRFILILQNKRAPARNPAPLKHEKKHPQKGAACQGFVLSAGTGSQRTALTIASVTGASGAPEEGLLKVELGDGIQIWLWYKDAHSLKFRRSRFRRIENILQTPYLPLAVKSPLIPTISQFH